MMKNILIYILTFALLAGSVFAFSMPHPVYGFIKDSGVPVSNLEVRVKNMNTAAEQIVTTDSSGFYQVELGNIDERYRDGDTIKTSLVYCESLDKCSKTALVNGGGNQISFDISAESITAPLPPTTIVGYVCYDKSVVRDPSLCPSVPIPVLPNPIVITQEKIVCEDGTEVETQADCPKKSNDAVILLTALSGLLVIAVVVLARFKWGKGYVKLIEYYKKKGDEALKKGDEKAAAKFYQRAINMANKGIEKVKK